MRPEESPPSTATSRNGGTQSLDRAAALIDMVIHSATPMSSTELSDATGLARSTTSRMLTALERTNLLERRSDGLYVGGQLFALYAALHDPWPQVARLADPVMQAVSERCGETVHLGIARAERVFHIAQVESTYLLRARDWNEVEVPLHASSLGKVLCAYGALKLPTGSLARLTPATLTRTQLATELADIPQRRYACVVDELEVGLSGLAAPVLGPDGSIIAVLGVSGPTARIAPRMHETGLMLADQAHKLQNLLRTPAHEKKGAA